MSFILTEEQEELLALVRKFSEKEILPYGSGFNSENCRFGIYGY